MPSLFSRSRTTSSPSKNLLAEPGSDEFGRVSSRTSFNTLGKKEKKEKSSRSRTAHAGPEHDAGEHAPQVPDGSFLPLNLTSPHVDAHEREQEHPGHDYGYISYKRHVVLGLEQVCRLVEVVTEELNSRGLTTPFVFSALALDVSAPAVNRMIESFLQTCSSPDSFSADKKWRDEARFAAPHELGICLRWGLARAVRVVGGQEVRGLLSYENYVEWRDSELAMNYPPTYFETFLSSFNPALRILLVSVLTLLIRLTAHSASSGHTPPTLSPLFGPLFFGLGPSSLSFHHSYHRYLQATNATEHIILAFIRFQNAAGSKGGMGVPARLKDWIRGYPAMLPSIPNKKQDKPHPRKGARTVRVASVRRNVRMYSPDLVKSAASWGRRMKVENSFSSSKEWERMTPSTLKLAPRYSDNYRKRMNLAPSFHPDMGAAISTPDFSASAIVSSSTTVLEDDGTLIGEDRFRSLTDLKWGEFEASGFGSLAVDEKKLQFDLTEGARARASRAAKRNTLSWTDFSAAGFSRTDAPLNTTLQFSAPLELTINQWPAQSIEINKKLKKAQRSLPVFGWDTEPVMASEEVVEEAFIDVFCDLIYGGGWMDSERGEEIDRECNWALVEFKSVPVSKSDTTSGSGDPRTASTLILFEEFVPYEYRQQLAASGSSRRRLPSLFSSAKAKQWKPAPTLNGRPYVIGSVPPPPHFREVELEGILRSGGSSTKVLRVSASKPVPVTKSNSAPLARISPLHSPTTDRSPATPRLGTISSPMYVGSVSEPQTSPIRSALLLSPTFNTSKFNSVVESPVTPRRSKFRLPTASPASYRRSVIPPAEYENIEFETRLASYSDDELNHGGRTRSQEEKRLSKDDAWVDILVAGRYNGQDAELTNGMRGLKGRSDPELASQEVAQALAAAKGHPPSDDEDEVVMKPITVPVRESFKEPIREPIRETRRLPSVDDKAERGSRPPIVMDEVLAHAPPSPTLKPRVTYFDLHPERRPSKGKELEEEDPRARFYSGDSDSEEVSLRKKSTDIMRDLGFDSGIEPLSYPPGNLGRSDPAVGSGHSKADSTTLPAIMVNIDTSPGPLSDSSVKSKTAALIEMYREKERVGTSPPQGSKAVRALPKIPPAQIAIENIPRTPSPSTSEDHDFLSKYDQSPSGPGRYVHGAPLHNVMEEEELY